MQAFILLPTRTVSTYDSTLISKTYCGGVDFLMKINCFSPRNPWCPLLVCLHVRVLSWVARGSILIKPESHFGEMR